MASALRSTRPYALTDTLTLNGRTKYWRDDNNFFVASFPANNSFVQFQQGFPVLVHGAPGSIRPTAP